MVLVDADNAEAHQFFVRWKEEVKALLRQVEIWIRKIRITTHPVEQS
jgi:hypothetical protein